ncbi:MULTISPECIES: RnfABCDGE type electron transport complex subunit D [unclassified Halanaerobium]|uniref:RnfABCDGE type electron transport complex subunit D n=1 Tax=unclassified Halanaerobium TaxID=2641197 RepID=UPI000DF37D60|nr:MULTISPECIES: RnfABCDGE type electron transport complex subunit D [unclassified Halanaerobium]RCW49692.1 electron transport complex protein RnfD [Halanaerobium sp. MA284_MarDTE_T2]RCW88377.1 electron transport complex protein RnfD [Halanaerobium sp. DL-01]
MNNEQLIVTSSPHIRAADSVSKIMWSVVISLIPAVFAAIYFFQARALSIVVVSVLGAVLTEYVFQKVRGKKITIKDGSAVVTGVLLALTLPPSIPLWTVLLGAVVSIGLGKQVFGGIGYNPFNPALVGRAFLMAAYPVIMTTWTVDGVSSATPLNNMKMQGIAADTWNLFVGHVGGSLGETSALALLLGFAFLLYKGYVNWRIPVGMVGTVFIFTLVFGANPIFHLFAGGLMLGSLFMATDMVSSPVTKNGRWIFGIGAGLIVVIIRLWGGYPEGVMYAILLMNTTVPLINRYTRPRSLGEVR